MAERPVAARALGYWHLAATPPTVFSLAFLLTKYRLWLRAANNGWLGTTVSLVVASFGSHNRGSATMGFVLEGVTSMAANRGRWA